jgi:chromosome segregation ATPase
MKQGRPGIEYNAFVTVWQELLNEGCATLHHALDRLGGSRSTLLRHRERYEQEQQSKAVDLIKRIKLTDVLVKSIAAIKLEEIDTLEGHNQALNARIDDSLHALKETEKKLTQALATVDEQQAKFAETTLAFERKLAISQAQIEDLQQREQTLQARCEQLNQQHNHALQDAAVAKKEVELLRERGPIRA